MSMIKKNMGTTDRILRISIAIGIGILYWKGILSGTLGNVLLVLSGVFIGTSLIRFCPLYPIFGITTCKVKKM